MTLKGFITFILVCSWKGHMTINGPKCPVTGACDVECIRCGASSSYNHDRQGMSFK